MKLIYSKKLICFFIDFNLKKVLLILFFFPFYTFSQNCTVNANTDRTICPGGLSSLPPDQFYLLGTENSGDTYLQAPVWTQISGNAVNIVTPNLAQSLVSGATPGNTYGFRLSAQCPDGATVSDDVFITLLPLTFANAGADMTDCPGTYTLNGNVPAPAESGTWSIEGGNGAGISIANPNSPTTSITISGTSGGSTTLRWTISDANISAPCTSFDEVIITSPGGVEPVTAGTDITLSNCYSSTQNINLNGSFGGNSPGQQQGTWTVVLGPNVPNFANVNVNNTNVSGLVEGTYVFRWTVAGSCANGFDEVTVTVPATTADVTDVADSTSYYCDGRTSTVLQGTAPLYVNETVQWIQTGGPTATIVNPTSPSTVVNGMTSIGTYTFLYTLTNSVTNCVSTATFVVVLENLISISGGPDQVLGCDVSTTTIPVTSTGSGQMRWQIVNGPSVNPLLNPPYPSFPTALVNFSGSSFTVNQLIYSGTYIVRVIKNPDPGSQCTTIYDDVEIVVSAQPTGSTAATKQVLACDVTEVTLAGNIPTKGTGTWSQVSGPTTVVFTDIHDPTTVASPLVSGRYNFRWTIFGGSACNVSQSITEVLVSDVAPTTATAGNDQSICFGSPVQLQGNAPVASETGTWTVTPSTGITFSDVNDPNSTASGLAANTVYTFTWTIVNGCGTTLDTVDVTTNDSQGANSNAGPDQCAPTGTSSITLAANDPSPGTGVWVKTSGGSSTITNPNQYNTTVTGLSDGDYEFTWTVSATGCTDASDTVAVTIAPTITVADAGPDQIICGNSVTVTGNTPAAGETGIWEFVSGGDGPVITNPTNPTTRITGLTGGSWVYKWTISRGACAASSDSVQLNIGTPPSIANAGPDQTVCNQNNVTLIAATPTVGIGIWSLISGPNSPVFSDVTSPTSNLSNLITGEYILEWTTYNGPNCPESKDQVSIKVTEPAAAGSDYSTCLEGPLYLAGNDGSIGTWTYISGPTTPTIIQTGNNSASVTGLIPGVYVFRYTIASDGSCPETFDEISVTINGQITTPPNAGTDQTFCDAGPLAIQLAASTPDPGTIGLWTKLSGPASGNFIDATNPNTIFANPGYGIYVFNWTVSAGTCTSSDQVRVENAQPPSPAVPQGDNAICGSTTELTATPPAVGTGTWAQVSGPTTATFSSLISPTTTVSNLTVTAGVYVFSWTVSNGTLCTPTTNNVTITVAADLTTPVAGPDQTICASENATLAANVITVGTGTWSIFSGPAPGGSFSNSASPTSTFTPNAAGTYVLRWTATNLSCAFFDDMTLIVDPLPSTANAGTPVSVCQFQPVNLNGNTPTVGTGLWTQVSGGTTAVFTDPTSPTTAVLGTQAGVYVFRWTISSGSCPSSASDVTVTINELPPLADAGTDQTICNTSTATLAGSNPGISIGTWTFVSNAGNTAVITNPNLFNTTVTGISTGITRLKWTISNGSCPPYSDEVQITKTSDLTTSPLTASSTICQGGTITLSTSPSGSLPPYTYQWQTSADGLSGWSDISGQTAASYTTDSALTIGEYYYRINVSNSCTQISSTVAKLTIIADPVVTTQPVGNTICSGGTHTMNVAATTTNLAAGVINYQWQSSADGTSGWTNVSGGSGATTDTYTTAALTSNLYFRARISQTGSGCETFSNPALVNVTTITVQPATPAPICNGGIVNISITASLNGGSGTLSYQWQSDSGSGFVNENNAAAITPNFTSDPLTTNTQFRCLVTSSTTNCTLTSNTVTATVVPDPVITVQPDNGAVCVGGSFTLSVTATGGTPGLNYQWNSGPDTTNFSPIPGANSSSYTTPALTTTTHYRVEVSATGNGCGSVTSENRIVVVGPDPVVNQQPVGSTICSGNTHTMSVVATGNAILPLAYQWQSSTNGTSGWVNVTGGTGANTDSYTSAALSSTLYYRVQVTQSPNGCETFSDAAPVFVATITTQPTNPTPICVGGIVNLTITASLNGGAGTLTYQWQSSPDGTTAWSNVTDGSGGTTSSYSSGPLSVNTFYRSAVTSSTTNCTLISDVVQAVVVPDPTITIQPTGTTICSGGNHTLTVTATNGTPSLTYQWASSTDNITFTTISGATSATYVTPALTQTTYYRVAVSASGNGCTTITSSAATVVVLSDIFITTQPVVRTNICSGSTATLNVAASGGSGNYTYQWKSATVLAGPYANVSGATSSSYTTPALTQNTYYQVVISDSTQGCDPVTSNVGAVIIPSIVTQPVAPATVCVGGTVSFSAAASANGGSATFAYQWQSSPNGTTGWVNVSTGTGGATANYTSGALSATTYYRAVITSSSPTCTLTTNVVMANVIPDPTITTQPTGGNICEGGTFTMSSLTTGGSGNFNYQWQQSINGNDGWANVTGGTGANTTTYTTGVVTSDTFYRLQVTDSGIGCGVINSNSAEVSVFESPLIFVQPTDADVCINQTHTFTVTATANIPSATLLYQWQTAPGLGGPYANVAAGTGGTTSSYTTPTYTTAGNRYFRVLISQSEAGCETISNEVTLDVFDVPVAPTGVVTQQPSCANLSGTIAITNPDLGTGYEYSKDGTTFQASNVFTGFSPGSNVTIYVRRVGLNTCISSGTTFAIFNKICAEPETFASISGDTGGSTGAQTILDSDTLNDVLVSPSDVVVSINSISTYLIFDPSTNTITVAPLTPADDYTLNYTICEVGNPSNCSTTTETISVTTAGIDARIDIVPFVVDGFVGANNVINALTNDRLASNPVDLTIVNLAVINPAAPIAPSLTAPELDVTTGNVNVPAGTAKGTYIIDYRICEIINPAVPSDPVNFSNCDTASIIVQVGTTVIDADDDSIANINGYVGQVNVINALDNDTLNGIGITSANINDITVTQEIGATPLYPGANVPTFSPTTGWVTVPAETPAGPYIITYHICEKLNPTNCSDASIGIVVAAAPLVVNDDVVNNVNGYTGAVNVINAYINPAGADTFNAQVININLADLLTASILTPAQPLVVGKPVPELVTSSGRVNVPSGTPAGQYQIKYQICENLNTPNVNLPDGGNCDDGIVTINVIAPPIIATDDAASGINSHTGATNVLNAYDNDLLNGGTLDLSEITTTITSGPGSIGGGPIPSFDVATGFVSVPALTPAGEYKFVYKICEILNASNCDQATITITVVPAQIDAVDDIPFASINGFIGNPSAINALDNDTLDGVLVDPADVEISVLTAATSINGSPVPILDPSTGNVSVPAGTAAGSYSITYRLRELLNLSNNDTAIITIEVIAPVIEANDDTVANVNGYVTTVNAINVLANDTLNGAPTNINQVTITVDTPATSINGGLVPVLVPLTGTVGIPAGTPAGNYEITYHICEKLNATNCDDATVFITVISAPIDAVDDTANNINGFVGANNVVNALTNDKLNGVSVVPSQVTISNVVPAIPINGGAIPVLDPLTGNVSVPAGTADGTYIIEYTLNENLNTANLDTAEITIIVTAPTIIANDDSANNINGFVGANSVVNVITNDRLNGMDIQLNTIDITSVNTVTPADYVSGNPLPLLNITTGNVNVPAGTSAGTYTIHYRICEKLNPSNCSEADIVITVLATGIIATDDFVQDINGYRGGNNVINALTNDLLNGTSVSFSQVNIRHIGTIVPLTSTNGNVPQLRVLTGNVDVPPLTQSGTYIIEYEICEKLNPANCSQASIYVVVDRPQILAEDDLITNIDGYRGAPEVLNALTSNDRYDGSPLTDLNLVIRTVVSPAAPIDGGAVPFLLPSTGLVSIPQRTPAGTYQIKYIICDRLNPLNCDEATITVLVLVPPIVANDDFVDNINGNTGANNVLNAYNNDTLDGLPMDFLDFKGTLITPASSLNGSPVPVFNELTGNVDVPAGTHAGTYFIAYQICGRLNSTNCDQAVITVRVIPAPIDAVDDTATGINGFVGTTNAINALDNDTLNGILVNPADVLITNVVPATPISGGTIPILDAAIGIVSVPAGTTAGTYIITYRLREATTLLNYDDATITIVVVAPAIVANDDTLTNVNGYVATNNAIDVLTNDTLNGAATSLSNVKVTVDTPATAINGGPVPILEPLTGKVSILAGTPTGDYQIKYHICENLNPTNCNDATVFITVVGPPIVAVDDTASNVNGYVGATNVVNALTNDTLNGSAVQVSQINITSLSTATPTGYVAGNPIPALNVVNGNVDVPAGTSDGTYTIHYSICEKLNSSNCDEADIVIEVSAATIIARDDVEVNVNGYVGSENLLNVLANDSFNDSSINAKKAKVTAINISQITITILAPANPISGSPNVPVLDPATGIVSVPPQTPAGLYTIQYRIAENLNPSNFDDATIFITVRTTAIEANNDTVLNINGFNGQANVVNAITNDNLNGVAAQLAEITIAVVTPATPINAGPVPTLDIVSGNVSVPAGTPSGAYTIRYSICENLNPTNCSQADIIVTVISGPIIANDDAATGINGLDGAANVFNVLTNDLLDNAAPTLSQVKITVLSPADPISGGRVPVLNASTGLVSVPAGTSSGIYTIVYSICENLNAVNCDQAVIKISVSQPGITLVKRGVFSDTNGDGYAQPGELIRYSFRITNTGSIDLTNVTVTDPKATIVGTPIASLPIGQFNTTNYTGTYVLTQADINTGFVVNQALVRAQPTVGTAIQDLSDSDDPTLIGNDDPTVTPVIQFKDITLIKGGQLTGTGGVGSIINYSFRVKNTGNVPLTNVVITDPMLTTTSIPVIPGTLAPGATGTATAAYTVKASDVANGAVINTALAIGDDPAGNPVTDVSDSTDPTLPGDDDPTVIDLTLRPSIALVKTAVFNDENKNGYAEIGETVTYHFAVTNTGNVVLVNIVVKDPKPGLTITGGPIILRQGETNTTAFVGTYVLTAADIDAGLVENQAEVTAVSPDGLTAKDLSDDNSNLEDDPTILPLNACKVTIYNAVSPDGDGKNEIFKIDGIECYANAYVQIYDRWGVLVYDAYNYDNNAVAFRGISEGRATVAKQKGLPDGTYFYVITYTTYLNEPVSKTGYLYLSGNN
jgi:gliding motility-associated-like protein